MTKAAPRRYGLSKSRITAFEQCPRRLWQQVHAPERAEVDDGVEQRFADGDEVGAIACSLHPEGVMISAEHGLAAAIKDTASLIAAGHPGPLFEATFEHDGVLVRVDILERKGRKSWQAYEVKSATEVKDYHIGDLATQAWVMREAGVNLAGAAIRHIDRSFILEEVRDFAGLFADDDCLGVVEPMIASRPSLVQQARKVLAGPEPKAAPGDHCTKPFACEFTEWCAKGGPKGPEWPVTILPNGGGRKWQRQGVESLLDLEEDQLGDKHARILAATRDDVPYHDQRGARAAMAEWGWPRAWLDFETINPAVPRWVGTRPYQQVPFQFSLHLQARNGRFSHHEFLDTSGNDPRLACAKALVASIPSDATIIAYNASFEIRVLNELADACPRYAKRLRSMAERTVDLLPIAREHWYHRDQLGSWSIKAVLPTMGHDGYERLQVKDGGGAQAAWLEASHPSTDPQRCGALEEAMRAYCKRDTEAMIAVARTLVGKGVSA